jgi:ankyrin repeat protein
MWAACSNDKQTIELCFKKDNDKYALHGSDGSNALHVAAWNGHAGGVQALIELKFDVQKEDSNGKTAAILAASKKDTGIVKLLGDAKADLNGDLFTCAKKGWNEPIQYLIEAGAKVNQENKNGETAAIVAAKGRHTLTVKRLQSNKADLKEDLFTCVEKGWHEPINSLIEAGVEVNDRKSLNSDGFRKQHVEAEYTPLCRAAQKGYGKVVEALLNKGADKTLTTYIEGAGWFWFFGLNDFTSYKLATEGNHAKTLK